MHLDLDWGSDDDCLSTSPRLLATSTEYDVSTVLMQSRFTTQLRNLNNLKTFAVVCRNLSVSRNQ